MAGRHSNGVISRILQRRICHSRKMVNITGNAQPTLECARMNVGQVLGF